MADFSKLKRKEIQALARAQGIAGLNRSNAALIADLHQLESQLPGLSKHDDNPNEPPKQACLEKAPIADCSQAPRIQKLESQIEALEQLVLALTTKVNELESRPVPEHCHRCLDSEQQEQTQQREQTERSPSPALSVASTNFDSLPRSFSVNNTLTAWQRKPFDATPARPAPLATTSIFRKSNPFAVGQTPHRSDTPSKPTHRPAPTPAATQKMLYGTAWKGQENKRASSVGSAWAQWRT